MDNTDFTILNLVQKNSRISLKEISQTVNLSVPATSDRLKKLKSRGIITGYTVTVDHEKLGVNLCCFCLVVLDNHNAHLYSDFHNYIAVTPDIIECHRVTGTYEYLLKIQTLSTKSLEGILGTLRARWGVVQSLTYTVLSTLKEGTSNIPKTSENTIRR